MIDKKKPPFTFIIRASGEATAENLKAQLSKKISKGDTLLMLDDEVSFEVKLRQGFDLAIKINNEFSVFIDGDILLRSNAVKRIRRIASKLEVSDLGFALRLWDRFYDRPKFRGLHIYKTELLKNALRHIPKIGEQMRPESHVKEKMAAQGHTWHEYLSLYVAGIHDFYQNPQDIYYKFLVRSKRSVVDIRELKNTFQSQPLNLDYKIALKGLEDGAKMDEVLNNKYLYVSDELKLDQLPADRNRDSIFINILILKKLIRRYNFNHNFWKSI